MRWLAVPLAFGFAHAVNAGELDSEYLRGSTATTRTYVVVQSPVQADHWRDPVQHYAIQPRAPERALAVAPRAPAPSGWTGAYAGLTAGLAAGSYGNRTSALGSGYMNATQAAAVTAAGDQTISSHGFAAGIEAGYNWQFGQFLIGGETDLQALHLNAAGNSGAVSYPGAAGDQFVVSSYGNSNWLFTARARAGLITSDNTLFFVTGGLALTQLDSNFLFTDNVGALESARINTMKTGFAVGAGVEAPLTDRLSMKAEYQYVNFGSAQATGTGNSLTALFPNRTFAHSGDMTANVARVGLNYHFNGGNVWPDAAIPSSNFRALTVNNSSWDVEAGARAWFNFGRIGAPQPLDNSPGSILASRLTFSGVNGASGEVFARADQADGFFFKGFLGTGATGSGQLNDEDFPAAGAYSNTQSSTTGHIAYATIDAGYTFLKTAAARLGAFVGYNYYEEDVNTYNCTQLAGAATCVAANPFPANFLGISQDGNYKSLRLGLSSQFMLTDRLRLTADVAYLPLVNFTGLDSHNARELLLLETASNGDGVMLEAMLDYHVTDAWNVGLGGRYWTWNMRTGTTTFNFLGAPPSTVEPGRYNSERYGMFVQSSYQWGGAATAVRTYAAAVAPMNWTGFYVGGHVGGGWSDDRWSDRFGSAPSGLGSTNIAGFGDTVRATGSLAGVQVGYDWQKGNLVFGVQADTSAADMVGENTCFSGLGGVNCQRTVNVIDTFTGRVGYAWGRSLGYLKAGGALFGVSYGLNGNTNAVSLGAGSSTGPTWGWTAGGGFEYALTDCWSTMLEYNYIGASSTSVSFPSVAVIGTANTSIQQAINTVKLGVNYRFNTGNPPVVIAKY
jgi:opacity protein-like surface antigen